MSAQTTQPLDSLLVRDLDIILPIYPHLIFHFFQIRITLLHRKADEPKLRVFLGLRNVTVDLCRYLKGTFQSNLMDVVIKDVKKFGNIFHPCPFSVGNKEHTFQSRYFVKASFFCCSVLSLSLFLSGSLTSDQLCGRRFDNASFDATRSLWIEHSVFNEPEWINSICFECHAERSHETSFIQKWVKDYEYWLIHWNSCTTLLDLYIRHSCIILMENLVLFGHSELGL